MIHLPPEISTPGEQTLALQRIMQLLPQVNRDTLFVLLHFLGLVADNSEDKIGSGEGKFWEIISPRHKGFMGIIRPEAVLMLPMYVP